jgi:hypothetical protein
MDWNLIRFRFRVRIVTGNGTSKISIAHFLRRTLPVRRERRVPKAIGQSAAPYLHFESNRIMMNVT